MSNEEILQKALIKAHANGMKSYFGCDERMFENFMRNIESVEPINFEGETTLQYMTKYGGYATMIFSHDFAKAFWGDNDIDLSSEDKIEISEWMESWQCHLQQMVLEEDPIKYLEKFL